MFRNKKTTLLVLALTLALAVEVANADYTFGTPTNLGPNVNSSDWDGGPSISADGLTLFFDRQRLGRQTIWVTTRETKEDDWGEPVELGPVVNTIASDGAQWQPSISADGLSLFFVADWGLWVTTRETTEYDWGTPVNLGATFNVGRNITPSISAEGLSLYFSSNRSGGSGSMDIWITTRETIDDFWGDPLNLGPIANSSAAENASSISADGLSLFFTDYPVQKPGGHGQSDLWITSRATTGDDWGQPMNLGPSVNTTYRDGGPSISADGYTLYFHSNRSGGSGDIDLWQVSIEPVVDLNGDSIVDAADMSIIVDNWGTDEPLCDIGPMPWGDGIVDVEDLIVLAEHLFEEVPPVE
jgi:Tol biopolymer transport system component